MRNSSIPLPEHPLDPERNLPSQQVFQPDQDLTPAPNQVQMALLPGASAGIKTSRMPGEQNSWRKAKVKPSNLLRVDHHQKRSPFFMLILMFFLLFSTACSFSGFENEVSFRLRNLVGKYLRQGLILDRNPKDGAVSGIYRDEQGQKIEFNVNANGFTSLSLYTRSEVLPRLLQVTDGCDIGFCLYYSYVNTEGYQDMITIDGVGELSAEERLAMQDLMNNDLVQGLSLLPLDIACQGPEKVDPKQVAALLVPLQMLFKYQIADRAAAASELISLSQCDYGSRTQDPDKNASIIQLTPSNPVPVVVGYFPFDDAGAMEGSSASVDGLKLACQQPSGLQNADSLTESVFLPDLNSFGSGPIRDEYGFCQAKCRGACGADCTINNCALTTEDRCEKNQDGENDGFLSLVYIYDCGLHPACIQHDDCYDDCNRRFGCDSWAAAYCMHAEILVTAPLEYSSGIYLSCDSETIVNEGLTDVLDWMRGYGPQPIRQIYEYSDKIHSYEYDPVRCPVGEGSGDEAGASDGQDPVPEGSDESTSIPAGTYFGIPALPAIWAAQQDFANFSIDENKITIIVEEDGTTHGEKILIYSYTATGIEGDPVYITNEWIITFEGTLHGTPYKLRAIASNHFVLTGPGTDNPVDFTESREGSYDIQIFENIMSGSPTNAADFEINDDLDMYTFEATRQ